MTIDEAFKKVHDAGMFVNSLWEIDIGKWRASVRNNIKVNPQYHFECCDGKTPQEAWIKAMKSTWRTSAEEEELI